LTLLDKPKKGKKIGSLTIKSDNIITLLDRPKWITNRAVHGMASRGVGFFDFCADPLQILAAFVAFED
jgi:hypothetical protein